MKWQVLFWAMVCLSLRLLGALNPEVSLDEGYSTFFTQVPLSSIILYAGIDTNPPLGNAFFHIVGRLAAYDLYLWRLPCLVASAVSIFVVYELVKPHVPDKVALLIIAMKAVSLCDLLYSKQVRAYPLAELLLLISWVHLDRIRSKSSVTSALLWGFCAGVACHLHYVCCLVSAASMVMATYLAIRENSIRLQVLIGSLTLALVAAPLSVLLLQQVVLYKTHSWIPAPQFSTIYVAAYQIFSYSTVGLGLAMVLMYGVFILVSPSSGITVAQKYRRPVVASSAMVALFVLFALCGSFSGGSFFYPRYFFYIQVPLLTLCALGTELYSRKPAAVLRALIILVMGCNSVLYLASLPTWVRDISTPQEGEVSEETMRVYTSQCSYLRGALAAGFKGRHRLVKSGQKSTVFQYPGTDTVYISEPELMNLSESYQTIPEKSCCGSETDITCRRRGALFQLRTTDGLSQ